MKSKKLLCSVALVTGLIVNGLVSAQSDLDGYWSLDQAREILDTTRRVELAPDLSALSEAERAVAGRLVEAGRILNDLYEVSRHPQSLQAFQILGEVNAPDDHVSALQDLYYMFKGPIATTLDNQRVPFLPVSAEVPGKNVYPAGLTREPLDALLNDRPDLAPELLGVRTVVRETMPSNLEHDLAMLARFPVLDGLHPVLRARLEAIHSGEDDVPFYALPYSVRWAPEVVQASTLISEAGRLVDKEDPDFSDYLHLRARDLLSDNYEGGDAAWVRGRFGNLNAQIGSYETYDDALYGVKSFFSLSLLARDAARSEELAAALGGLQAIQDSLPHGAGRKVQQDIPVGVYNVIADFGQSRGANTATILPNNPDHARKYGRTILLRYNIMTHPGLFDDARQVFAAAVIPGQADDLTLQGPFNRTLWHEVGHYLGVIKTTDGRNLDEALSPWGSHFEEMKADLVSLFTCAYLNGNGQMDDALYRSVQASGVLRTLQRNQPRREQPYQTMQLMQMNYFLEHGLLSFEPSSGRLEIHYDMYQPVVARMLEEVLAIQSGGSDEAAARFIDRYTSWTPELHGRLAEGIRGSARYQYRVVRYKYLGSESAQMHK
jgi:hypothetical protein